MSSTPAPAPAPARGSEPPHALVERRGHVLIVTMNRPQARNALTGPMMAVMRGAWDQVDRAPGIRACVLTGAGGAFCAGADLKAMPRDHPGDRFRDGTTNGAAAAGAGSAGRQDMSVLEPLLKGRRLTKPLVAAV